MKLQIPCKTYVYIITFLLVLVLDIDTSQAGIRARKHRNSVYVPTAPRESATAYDDYEASRVSDDAIKVIDSLPFDVVRKLAALRWQTHFLENNDKPLHPEHPEHPDENTYCEIGECFIETSKKPCPPKLPPRNPASPKPAPGSEVQTGLLSLRAQAHLYLNMIHEMPKDKQDEMRNEFYKQSCKKLANDTSGTEEITKEEIAQIFGINTDKTYSSAYDHVCINDDLVHDSQPTYINQEFGKATEGHESDGPYLDMNPAPSSDKNPSTGNLYINCRHNVQPAKKQTSGPDDQKAKQQTSGSNDQKAKQQTSKPGEISHIMYTTSV